MRLAIAPGSLGHYRIDRDGLIYTEHQFVLDPDGRRGPRPGQKPKKGEYQQYAYSTPFWLPTGQVEEPPPASLFEEAA